MEIQEKLKAAKEELYKNNKKEDGLFEKVANTRIAVMTSFLKWIK